LSFCGTTSDLRRLLEVAAAQPNLQTLHTTPSESGYQGASLKPCHSCPTKCNIRFNIFYSVFILTKKIKHDNFENDDSSAIFGSYVPKPQLQRLTCGGSRRVEPPLMPL
jgi:hypothetical protein